MASRAEPIATGSYPRRRPPARNEAATDLGPTDRDILELTFGRTWTNHVVPRPTAFSKRSAIGDMAPGAENDAPPDRRREYSSALGRRIASSCAGWAAPPTARELYDSFHTRTPTTRSQTILRMWMTEASTNDVVEAWIDHCYSWRELAEACERHFIYAAENAKILNRMRQEHPELGTCRQCGTEPASRRRGDTPVCPTCAGASSR